MSLLDEYIERMLVASTAHLTQATVERLPRGHSDMESPDDLPPWATIVMARGEGWLFFVSSDRYSEAPADLRALIDVAKANSCEWLLVDADAKELPDLPTYEWP